MPIEIKELHIRINVSEGTKTPAPQSGPKDNQQDVMAQCVEQVMKIIERKKER